MYTNLFSNNPNDYFSPELKEKLTEMLEKCKTNSDEPLSTTLYRVACELVIAGVLSAEYLEDYLLRQHKILGLDYCNSDKKISSQNLDVFYLTGQP